MLGGRRFLAGLFSLPPLDQEPFKDRDGVSIIRLELGATELKECFKMHGRAGEKVEKHLKANESS